MNYGRKELSDLKNCSAFRIDCTFICSSTFFCAHALIELSFVSHLFSLLFFLANLCSAMKSDQEAAAAAAAVSSKKREKCNCGCKFLICSLFICRLPSLPLAHSFSSFIYLASNDNNVCRWEKNI